MVLLTDKIRAVRSAVKLSDVAFLVAVFVALFVLIGGVGR